MSVERANELAGIARAAVAAAGIAAHVTLDTLEIPGALKNQPVVVVQPPDMTFDTYTVTDTEWEIYVIAGPVQDRVKAWANIHALLMALKDPLAADTAEPANYQPLNGPAYPAYIIRMAETVMES